MGLHNTLTALLLVGLVACRGGKSTTETGLIDEGGPADADGDGFDASEDCDDGDEDVNPSMLEICDGIDNNCDGAIDEGVTEVYFADADADGFGNEGSTVQACDPPSGFVSTGNDCDDSDPDSHPGATERCDGADNDCDGEIDEDVLFSWYADADADGFGDTDAATEDCDPPEGYVDNADDCDDLDSASHPGGTEVCDEADNNCDGTVDEGVTTTYHQDADGDSFGVADTTTEACSTPGGYAEASGDCDDLDATVSPNATELCDGIDNDCDGDTDEDDAADATTWYGDGDADGYGDSSRADVSCDQPSGYVADDTDCDDSSSDTHPSATEVCDDEDNDCNGLIDENATDASTWYGDRDGDGYGGTRFVRIDCDQPSSYVSNNTDCDDLDADSYPGGTEVCDEADNDCDGSTDEGVTVDFYADDDGDGYGDAGDTVTGCTAPTGYVGDDTDCDDADADRSPREPEVCDEIDNNCDGATDEGVESTFYADSDGDGYGDPDTTTAACEAGSGYIADDTDCDDGDASVNPGADEVWYDGVDQDCDAESDYDQDGDGDDYDEYGGTDCDDEDADISDGDSCRADCTPPSPSTLAAYDPTGVSDITFDEDCTAYLATIISGQDYVYTMTSSGSTTALYGYSNYDINAVALDPSSGDVVVAYSSTSSVGLVDTSSSYPIVFGSFNSGSLWSNGYLNWCASSLAVDSDGCAWTPNLSGRGYLDCVDLDAGTKSSLTSFSSRIESVGLDDDEALYVSVDDELIAVDTSDGSTSTVYTAADDILDFVFDTNGDAYIETDGGEILLLEDGDSSASTFDTVSGQGKLAISPDGTLYRVRPNPVSAASYESWSLD